MCKKKKGKLIGSAIIYHSVDEKFKSSQIQLYVRAAIYVQEAKM